MRQTLPPFVYEVLALDLDTTLSYTKYNCNSFLFSALLDDDTLIDNIAASFRNGWFASVMFIHWRSSGIPINIK